MLLLKLAARHLAGNIPIANRTTHHPDIIHEKRNMVSLLDLCCANLILHFLASQATGEMSTAS
jgi:hypothetical protein